MVLQLDLAAGIDRFAALPIVFQSDIVDHDFTVDEQMSTDPDVLKFPKDEAEAKDRWRKRIKYDLLSLKLEKLDKSDKPVEEPTKRLHKRYDTIKRTAHDTMWQQSLPRRSSKPQRPPH